MDVLLPQGTIYILVIDTDSYAGNFERELAGYTTGIFDYQRAHGEKEAEGAKKANPMLTEALEEKSLPVQHEEYEEVTNTIRATPGRANNGMGWAYDASDLEAEALARQKAIDSMRAYHASQIARCEQRLADEDFEPEKPGAWTKEACERTIESAHASIARAGQFVGWPAYESVAMFFSEPLSEEEMEFVKQRAYEYAASPSGMMVKPFQILDIYMLKVTSGTDEERL